ncbi:arsenate-mycothiol transferase ArsC1 [Oxobacter pfennigii]|uniref:Arsenate-mycothiol transferase ArsC1 n=1 Tax=Oxobacter pfennigii TaxID=36849 RepID=A0A0P8WDP3_9CLOT|nr:arsenate reductase ArsC [Oxobacter pfennigii]KPU45869.1 arsenate-mycothiol transferase ArsC1 [Oxobacter pfennigii]
MKPKVAFICVHNSCRSQMSEALGKLFASDVFQCYSAGTEKKTELNPDAVKVIKEMYGVDMNQTQYPKLIEDLPKVDIAIKMGCNVVCPIVYAKHIEDWGLDDPTGKGEDEFRKTAKLIEEKVKDLAESIKNNVIEL